MNNINQKHIVIAGGAGFLGSHLCDKLIDDKYRITCIDNCVTGRVQNIEHLANNQLFKFEFADISGDILFDKADQIYNLACPASPLHYQADPLYTLKTNVVGTMNMLRLADTFSSRFVQASTSEIYGNPEVHPQSENYVGNVNCTGIRSCYDEGKRAAECACFDYIRCHNTDVRVARIFNTYGPRMAMHDGRVVSNFIVQALLDDDMTVYGDGSQTRSLCYVDDMIDGLISIMNVVDNSSPINLGNPQELTILELAEKIREFVNSKSNIVFKELPADDPCKRRPNIDKAIQKLGWEPRVQLDVGLKKTIDYFENELSNRPVITGVSAEQYK